MELDFRLYASLRKPTGGKHVLFEAPASTVRQAIDALVDRYPDLGEMLLEDGAVRNFVAVILNGRDIRHLDGLDTPIKPGDEFDIFPPVAGGAPRDTSEDTITITETIRGLPEWLIRDYLAALGAHPSENGTPRMTAPTWRATWTSRKAAVTPALSLTEFEITFTGTPQPTTAAHATFMRKAQRGGG